MQIFSSYYDNAMKLDLDAYTPVRVSRTPPPEAFLKAHGDYVDLSDTFGPTVAMLADCNPLQEKWEAFRPRYIKEILGALDKAETLDLLKRIYHDHGDKPLLLLCYETAQENCHRRLIGDFLDIEVKELD